MVRVKATIRASILLSILALLLIPIGKVDAHAYSASYTTLTLTKANIGMTYTLDELSVIELTDGDVNKNSMLEPEEFDAVKDRILELLKKDIQLEIDNVPQEWSQIESFTLKREGDATKVILNITFPPVLASQSISLTDNLYLIDKNTANYVDLVKINYGTQNSTSALSGKYRVWSMQLTESDYAALRQDLQSQPNSNSTESGGTESSDGLGHISGWFSFFTLGMGHILGGYDHLLFLFSLLIARQTFKQYAKMITAFTIAHSITLTLTVLGIINIPAWFVEPAIALSICYVAVENIVRKDVSYRWVLTFLFGLIHGMGFADILKEMDIPRSELATDLISFNLGIETIQVALVALLLLPLIMLHRWKFLRRAVIVGSAIALILGAYWLIDRIIIMSA
ncbi:hydrogenase/urease accessory protein HupE [Paenibacillus castaneae]|uniref:HupE/UreJ family protein n=1 Tax=Paenibacillus castaneae TaxID=474957 RepID=UPI000C9B0F33|nr:HupE/UreJ family protein [Paenibacillus castaneae]NIK78004.1 hydrogenase/urease accessory protein HupE [Paenibacillus castaneae]